MSIARYLALSTDKTLPESTRVMFAAQAKVAFEKAVPQPVIGRPGTGAKLIAAHYAAQSKSKQPTK